MNESDFEGTLVLEQLAAIGQVDAFYDAVDSDNFALARSLMERAGLAQGTVEVVLAKMRRAPE